jgi:hypothetical protein
MFVMHELLLKRVKEEKISMADLQIQRVDNEAGE